MRTRIEKKDKSLRRKERVTFKVRKNTGRHVLYVFRSNKYIYAQIVDSSGKTLLGVSSRSISGQSGPEDKKGRINISFQTGKAIAQKAREMKITDVVFNRGSYKFHGRIKALAQGAREGGLKF
ncbi:MAG: 50S ribosomal protein L18 [Actinobacteria bacterium]|nr:50S ribosomal protein L18 [Actinomycetota bacterium]